MTFANFQDLCESVCDLADVKPPRLEADADGCVAFTLSHEGVDIGFIEEGSDEPTAMLVTNFGVPGGDDPDVLGWLSQANFVHSAVGAPVFVHDPDEGEVALHQPWPLASSTAQDIYAAIQRIVAAATQWKQ